MPNMQGVPAAMRPNIFDPFPYAEKVFDALERKRAREERMYAMLQDIGFRREKMQETRAAREEARGGERRQAISQIRQTILEKFTEWDKRKAAGEKVSASEVADFQKMVRNAGEGAGLSTGEIDLLESPIQTRYGKTPVLGEKGEKLTRGERQKRAKELREKGVITPKKEAEEIRLGYEEREKETEEVAKTWDAFYKTFGPHPMTKRPGYGKYDWGLLGKLFGEEPRGEPGDIVTPTEIPATWRREPGVMPAFHTPERMAPAEPFNKTIEELLMGAFAPTAAPQEPLKWTHGG